MALRLGIGRLGLGAARGGAAAIAPAFVTSPAIADTPVIGTAVAPGEFTYTGTEPVTPTYQWKRAGVDIAGATSATFTETVDATAYGKLLSRVIRLTNAAGFVEYETTAPAVTGKQMSEDWSSRAAGDDWATLDANGWERRSAASSANVIADAAAPSGKSAEFVLTSNNDRPIMRDDMKAFSIANSAETDRFQTLHMIRPKAPAGGRYGLRNYDTLAAGLPSSDFGFFYYSNGNIWLQVTADKDTDAGSSLGADLVADSLYFVRQEYDATHVRARVWRTTDPEPDDWTSRAATVPYATLCPAFSGRNITTAPGVLYNLLYLSGGWNADAPFYDGYTPPEAVSADPMSFAALASDDTVTAFDSLITFTLEDI